MTRRFLSPLRMALAALFAMVVVVAVQAPAQAALPAGHSVSTWTVDRDGASYSRTIEIRNGSGSAVGDGSFNADPVSNPSIPGDAIQACDSLADGWGIEIRMDISPGSTWRTDRIATTRGYNSPYCSPWQSGNIGEDTQVGLRLCMVKGTSEYCTSTYYARA